MASLDFSKFSFNAEEVRAVNELVWDEVLQAPELELLHTIYPNIVFDKEIGFIGEGGLVGVARQNCDPIPQTWKIGSRVLKWEPRAWEILLEECFSDLEATAAVYSLKTGVDIADFISTDYMNIVIEALTQSIKKFIIRLVWFSDMQAKNVSVGGIITDGVDTKYFTILNGLWKQILYQTTVNSSQLVTITENAGATYAAQQLNPDNVKGYLTKLVFGANILLRGKTNGFIPCTQSFYDAYAISLQGVQLETMYANLVNGQKTLTFNGVPLLAMPIWDEMISMFENDGTKLNNPHRALYVTKDILAVGVDGEDSFEKMNVWYNKDSRKVKTELMGKADTKLLRPDMFNLAI